MTLQEMLDNDPEFKAQYEATLEEQATAKAQEATVGLIKKRDELLAEKKAAKNELEELRSRVDPDKYEEAIKLLREKEEAELTLEERAAKREQELLNSFKNRETEIIKGNEEALTSLQTQIEAKDKALRNYLVEKELNAAIASAEGVPELLVPVLKDKIKVVEDNGEYIARVFDGDTPRVGDSKGNYMNINQLVQEAKANPIFGGAFRSSGASGGGASGDNGGNSSGNVGDTTSRAKMTFKERSAFISENGQAAYLALPA